MVSPQIHTILNSFSPVTLEEMEALRLMNRMDTKFVFSAGLLPEFLHSLAPDYKILEIGQRRDSIYNTKYLDTEDLLFYIQHVRGKLARHKIRFRKYESTGATFLEIKKKTNRNRTVKWRTENCFVNDILDDPATQFIKKHLPYNSSPLQVKLENKFTRITLAGFETKERITLDYCMSFSSSNGALIELPYLAIAELKSEGFPSWSPFVLVAKKFGIKPTGFSKYCMGNVLLKDLPKKNVLKQKIILLNKIENEYSKLNVS